MAKDTVASSWTLDEWADGSDVSVPEPTGIVYPGASWATDTPANQGLDGTAVSTFVTALGTSNGVLVRNGYVVDDWGDPTGKENMASMTKAVTNAMLWFAQEDTLITSPNDLVSSFGWSMISKDASMTLAHLASMRSGYMLAELPGQASAYNDYAVQVLATTIFDEIFADTPNNVVTANLAALGFEDGSVYGSYSLNCSWRDAARIGWWYLNRGRWGASQLVPRTYFEDWWRVHIPASVPRTSGISNGESPADYLGVGTFGGTQNSGIPIQGVYGFGWWFNHGLLPNGQRIAPSAPANLRFALGHSNKIMLLWPDEQIVCCCISDAWGDLATDAGVASSPLDDMLALFAAVVP